MSPANRTRAALAVGLVAAAAWEAFGLATDHVSLISPVITDVLQGFPLVTFIAGVLCGHWIGGRGTTPKEEGK